MARLVRAAVAARSSRWIVNSGPPVALRTHCKPTYILLQAKLRRLTAPRGYLQRTGRCSTRHGCFVTLGNSGRQPSAARGQPGTTRLAYDQLTTEAYLARNHVAPREPLKHHCQRRLTNFPGRLTQSRQRHRQETCVVHIIDAHQPNIMRNSVLELQQRMHQMSCGAVVGAGDPLGTPGLHDRLDTLDVVRVHAVRQGPIELHTGRVQCLPVPRFALIDGRGGVLGANEKNAPTSEAQEMLRDDVSGTTIVDADEVMTSSLRVRNEGTIQKDHGNSSRIEGADNSSVVLVLRRREFQRREEDSGDLALDVLQAQFPGSFLLRPLSRGGAPEERVPARSRGGHHALPDRFEDGGFLAVGDQESERAATGGGPPLHEGSGTGSPLHEPRRLQVSHGAPDRYARNTKPLDELRLTRQALAELPAAQMNLPTQGRIDLAVLARRARTCGLR